MIAHRLQGHHKPIVCVATSRTVSPEGQLIVTSSEDKTIKLWDLATGQSLRTLESFEGPVYFVDLSADGSRLVTVSHKTILWALDGRTITREKVLKLRGRNVALGDVTFSPDGLKIAGVTIDDTVDTWSAESGEQLQTFSGHRGHVYCAAWSPDSKLVASSGDDLSVRVWDGNTGTEVIRPLRGHARKIWCVSFGADDKLLVSASEDGSIVIWDLATERQKHTLQGHTSDVWSMAISPDGRLIVSASEDGTVRVWDITTGQQHRLLVNDRNIVSTVAWSRDGESIVSGGDDGIVYVWQADVKVCVYTRIYVCVICCVFDLCV
jgi:WD40 repeat protein